MPDSSQADRSLFSLAQIQHLIRVEFNRAQRYGYPLCCMMIAVDRLGHLRDLYGYESKESILDSVVDLLKRETRVSDFLGRLADDRLLAVVPHTGPDGGWILAERLVQSCHGLSFQSDGRQIAVTLSIGVAYSDGNEVMFFDALLGASEDALQAATTGGGDRAEMLPVGS
tara:strand:- start:2754 stop:3263 length:510 start_codon:yes stop_codon:yes gene_type:complete